MSKYRKFLIALAAALSIASAALADGDLSGADGGSIGIALAGAALVWLIPNEKP